MSNFLRFFYTLNISFLTLLLFLTDVCYLSLATLSKHRKTFITPITLVLIMNLLCQRRTMWRNAGLTWLLLIQKRILFVLKLSLRRKIITSTSCARKNSAFYKGLKLIKIMYTLAKILHNCFVLFFNCFDCCNIWRKQ